MYFIYHLKKQIYTLIYKKRDIFSVRTDAKNVVGWVGGFVLYAGCVNLKSAMPLKNDIALTYL
jgi:hypothetical protein